VQERLGLCPKPCQGALPLGSPPKAEPLESISFRKGVGFPVHRRDKCEAAPTPFLKLRVLRAKPLAEVQEAAPPGGVWGRAPAFPRTSTILTP
jgi:hypothetical protein